MQKSQTRHSGTVAENEPSSLGHFAQCHRSISEELGERFTGHITATVHGSVAFLPHVPVKTPKRRVEDNPMPRLRYPVRPVFVLGISHFFVEWKLVTGASAYQGTAVSKARKAVVEWTVLHDDVVRCSDDEALFR